MPTVVATPGSANANSYVTLLEAAAYMDLLPTVANATDAPGDVFNDADAAEQERAVILATMLLDANIPWLGAATTAVQALSWPRQGLVNRNGYPIPIDAIPMELKRATSEYARQLLMSDRLSDNDVQRQGITEIKAGPVALKFNKDFKWNAEASIVIPDSVRALLVPSWYVLKTYPAILKVL